MFVYQVLALSVEICSYFFYLGKELTGNTHHNQTLVIVMHDEA